MHMTFKSCMMLLLVFTVSIAVVAQQTVAMLYVNGDVSINGVAVAHDSSVLVAGDKIASGRKAITTISVPGASPTIARVGSSSSLVYTGTGLQLNFGAVLMASNGRTSVQLDGLTVSAPESGEFLVTTRPARNISCVKGTCTVTDGKASVRLKAGEALVAKARQTGSGQNQGTQGQGGSTGGGSQTGGAGGTGAGAGAAGGIPGWVIGVFAAAAAAGIGTAIAVNQTQKPPSPSVP